MAKYELIGAEGVLDYVCEKFGVSRSVAIDIWASQFNFIRDTIGSKTIRFKHYPSFLIYKFGKMYCPPWLFKKCLRFRYEEEVV